MSHELVRYFGDMVFNDHVMRARLSLDTYQSLKATIEAAEPLDSSIAGEVAAAMKQWAIEKGATHYTHWFMPMTGTTGEKHDSFIQPTVGGKIILEFSGKALIKGEPDASSFPSGGLRETSAARGYTAWDCTSPAFVKEGTLYIPTAFFSHTGEVLDKKAPLLRSVEALNRQGMRIIRLFGNKTAKKIISTIGPEQEYFLIDSKDYEKRPDLRYTGRTLFGARPSKGQELSDQYFGIISERVAAFMHELDDALWRFGVTARTKHNEVAPGQHELAVVFDPSSVAADHNMLVMEMLGKIAKRHGMVCLLHEKPFKNLSGSGKHINWSIATDEGENLLDPGEDITKNPQYLIFLGAVIKALDTYGDLVLMSISTAANEHRLGSHEAPPSILSMAVGEDLEQLIHCIEEGKPLVKMDQISTNLGVASMSLCTVDTTDRNRTSPFAYTGNRFEFRMPGSSVNVAGPCYILNAIVAESLATIADDLAGAKDVHARAYDIFKQIILRHKRIIYGGDNYAESWAVEAKKRGLIRLDNTVDAIHQFIQEKNIQLLSSQNVLTREETIARHDVMLENYAYVIAIEARTAIDMINKDIVPATLKYVSELYTCIEQWKTLEMSVEPILDRHKKISELLKHILMGVFELEAVAKEAEAIKDYYTRAKFYSIEVRDKMAEVRSYVDELELIMPTEIWPYPSYGQMLYRN